MPKRPLQACVKLNSVFQILLLLLLLLYYYGPVFNYHLSGPFVIRCATIGMPIMAVQNAKKHMNR